MTTKEVLTALAGVGAARRGQITEQWYSVKDKNGEQKKQGPYFVWTWYDQGVKHTARIPAKEIEKARGEIERGKNVEQLMAEFWRNAEAAAKDPEKKTLGTIHSKPERKSAKQSN